MCHVPFLIRVWLLFLCTDQMLQHGQEILDSLAEIKKSIMTRYEQWQANPSAIQFQPPQPPASNLVPQSLIAHRSIHSHGTNTPTSSSTPSSSRSRASIPPRSRTPSPYDRSPHEEDMARHEHVDAMLRDEPRWREEAYSADGARPEQLHAREDDTRRRREWEEEGRRRTAEQRGRSKMVYFADSKRRSMLRKLRGSDTRLVRIRLLQLPRRCLFPRLSLRQTHRFNILPSSRGQGLPP
ncbi:hypothetical protein BJV74DRAFT_300156 [Russula compacta]|nr:hypothetical protein BJV74DRAFT_300156 [Russula compacta]